MAECEIEVEHERIAAMQSDCVYDFYCEYCKDDGLNTEAVGYCVDCNDYLCQGCINAHKRSRPTRHHELLDQNKMPREAPLSQDRVNREIVTKCILHNNKTVEYYCVSHRELVCSTCFVKVHRHCKEIQSINEESESIIGSREYNDFTDGLKDMNKKASDMISKAHDNKTALDRLTTKATEQLKSFRAEVNAIFDEMEKSLLTEIRSILSEDNESMDKMTGNLTKNSDQAKALMEETEKLADSKLVCQLFIQIKEKQNNLVSLKEKLRQAEERNKVRMIEFEANNDIRTAFKATGLGKIKVQTRCVNSIDRSPATPTKTDGDYKPTKGPDFSSNSTTPIFSGLNVVLSKPLPTTHPGIGIPNNDRTAPDVSKIKVEPQAPTQSNYVDGNSSSRLKAGNLHIVELSEDRIQYDREFLLHLRSAPASMAKPEGLPDIPDIMHIQPSTDQELVKQMEEIIQKDKEPFVLPTRSAQSQKGQRPKPHAKIKKEDILLDAINLKYNTTPSSKNERRLEEMETETILWTGDSVSSFNSASIQHQAPSSVFTHHHFEQPPEPIVPSYLYGETKRTQQQYLQQQHPHQQQQLHQSYQQAGLSLQRTQYMQQIQQHHQQQRQQERIQQLGQQRTPRCGRGGPLRRTFDH